MRPVRHPTCFQAVRDQAWLRALTAHYVPVLGDFLSMNQEELSLVHRASPHSSPCMQSAPQHLVWCGSEVHEDQSLPVTHEALLWPCETEENFHSNHSPLRSQGSGENRISALALRTTPLNTTCTFKQGTSERALDRGTRA